MRRAGPEDWAALRQVRLAGLAEAPEAFASTLEHEQAFGEEVWRDRLQTAIWFLAWQGNDPVGMVAAFPAAGNAPASGPAGEWHLVSMWAGPQVRGQGVADQLVAALARAVKAAGGERLALWVADGNDRARGFYLRYGFQPTGRRQAYRRRDGSEFDEDEFTMAL